MTFSAKTPDDELAEEGRRMISAWEKFVEQMEAGREYLTWDLPVLPRERRHLDSAWHHLRAAAGLSGVVLPSERK